MTTKTSLNIQLLMTGNELMTGDIVDSNSAMMAQYLKALGLEVTKKTTVSDDIMLLSDEINTLSKTADILIINGGLGPTIDDLTAQVVASTINEPLVQHPEALDHLKQWCENRGVALNKPNLKQAILPEGCQIIPNRKGSAVGFSVTHQGCEIFCTPGVPRELETMFTEQILPAITKNSPTEFALDVTRLQLFGLGESNLQKLIDDNLADWPTEIELGFRAGLPLLEVKLTTKSQKGKELQALYLPKLKTLLGDHILGEVIDKPKSLAQYVVELLNKQNEKITLAESCTGGLIASLITQVSGASSVFEAGIVSYSNDIKSQILGVNKATLEQNGAVSKATVEEMALGALKLANADIAIAVSGVAGPSGGTEEKPVGTVWIAWGREDNIQSQCFFIPVTRTYFQSYVAAISLDLIRRVLINSQEIPAYVTDRGVKKP